MIDIEKQNKVFDGAISATGNLVTHHLNPDGRLEKITRVVVIYLNTGFYDIYRTSSTEGLISKESVNIATKEKTKATAADKYNFPPQLDNNRPIVQFALNDIRCSAYVDTMSNGHNKTTIKNMLKEAFDLNEDTIV